MLNSSYYSLLARDKISQVRNLW